MTADATKGNAEQWHIPPQQCVQAPIGDVHAKYVLDLRPLLEHHQSELQRLRDQLAVERGATSSAREALAACEERARVLGTQFELSKMALGQSRMAAEEGMREHDRMRRELEQAKTVPPGLVPGSTAAVIEAYRLLRGATPRWDDGKREWTGVAEISGHHRRLVSCSTHLLVWLDENAPGGKP